MKSNEALQKQVEDALLWEPSLTTSDIDAMAQDGIITLSGLVDSYAKKLAAEAAAKSVAGVKAVVEKIRLGTNSWSVKTDGDIAAQVVNAIKWNRDIINDSVKVRVEQGWVTLEGSLRWNYQKEAVQQAVSNLTGIRGITNSITILPATGHTISEAEVMSALNRNVALDTSDIDITVAQNEITLKGTVDSWYQKNLAGKIAWKTPGVTHVYNELETQYKGIAHLIDVV